MLNFRDFFVLAPEIVLAVWGLLVLMVDLGPAPRHRPAAQRRAIGRLARRWRASSSRWSSRSCPLLVRFDLYGASSDGSTSPGSTTSRNPDPYLFFGTISGDLLTELFNLLFIVLLALVVVDVDDLVVHRGLGRVLRPAASGRPWA